MVNRLKKFFSGTYLGLMLVFLYAPILILIVFSFNQSKTLGNWTGFTFDWYVQLFRTPEITDALAVTLSVAAISSIVSTVLGLVPFLYDGPEEVFWFAFAMAAISGTLFSIVALEVPRPKNSTVMESSVPRLPSNLFRTSDWEISVVSSVIGAE